MDNPSQSQDASPITQLVPYFAATFSALKHTIRLLSGGIRPLVALSPVPAFLYLLAPVFVFLDLTATIFVRTPYRTVTYLLEALHPLYVFVGVACITGSILGLAARVLSRAIIVSLEHTNADASVLPAVKDEPVKAVDQKQGRAREKARVIS